MRFCLVIVFSLFSLLSKGQSVINSAGNENFSAGNVFYKTFKSGHFEMIHGVLYSFKDDYILSVSDLDKNTKVYPNPFNDVVYIQSKQIDSIYLYNVSGVLVFEEKINKKDFVLNLNSLHVGTYFLKIISGKEIVNLKLIKL